MRQGAYDRTVFIASLQDDGQTEAEMYRRFHLR